MIISNPLGANGYGGAPLGNLTAGVEALQKTEINRRLQEIEQEKAQRRSDALKNEEFALRMASTDVINDKRVSIAEQAAKDAEAFMQTNTEMVKKAQSEGRGLTLAEKMKLITEQKKILSSNANAANFTDALEKAQSIHISTLKTLKDPVSKDQYNKQWADLYVKMKDPTLSRDLSPSDIISAIEPPPPPSSVVFNETAKGLLPFVDSSVKAAGNGRTEVDKDKLMQAIKSNVPEDDYLFTKGREEGRWGTPDEMYNQLAERIAPSIKTNVTGWAPTSGGSGSEADRVQEVPTFIESVDPSIPSGKGVSLPRSGRALPLTIGEGDGKSGADFTPTQYVNKTMQGEFKGVKYVKREGIPAKDAYRDKDNDSRIKIKSERVVDGKKIVDAEYPEIDTWYGSVPYDQIRDEVKDRFPEVERKYQEDTKLDPAKKRMADIEDRIRNERLSGKSSKSTAKPKSDPLGLFK